MGKKHIAALFIFALHVSFCMVIGVGVDQNHGWTEVKGMESYELMSDILSILI